VYSLEEGVINELFLLSEQCDFLLHNEARNTTKSTLKTEYESPT